ncbi:DoxX family protein (plasmid) [Enterobacter asburiae]
MMQPALRALLSSPGCRRFLPLMIIRGAFGLFFFTSGFNKVFVPENQALMLETVQGAGIPYPHIMSVFVACCEMLCGLLLACGLLTRLNAAVLMIITLVALFTVSLEAIPQGINLLTWYSWLLYLPESGYVLMCILLAVQGCGPFGLDRVIAHRLRAKSPREI